MSLSMPVSMPSSLYMSMLLFFLYLFSVFWYICCLRRPAQSTVPSLYRGTDWAGDKPVLNRDYCITVRCATIELPHLHSYVHAECSCPCCMPLSMLCPRCLSMSLLHAHTLTVCPCPCYMPMTMTPMLICVFMLCVHAACPCCVSMLLIHAAWTRI